MQPQMPIPTGVPSMNSQAMIDNFKSMIITMTMLKGTSQTDSSSSLMNTIAIMLVISFIDTFVIQIKRALSIATSKFENYITSKTNTIGLHLFTFQTPIFVPIKIYNTFLLYI